LLHHVPVKFPVIVASATLACKVFAAELRVDEKDLPRVPATEPAQAAATMQVRDGFRVEVVASEPLIASPVAMAFDENGRLYVAEMRDYSERRDERLGRIKLLEDTNGDGRFDKATVFADKLPWPTAIICWDGGVFIGATPDILYFKDTDDDGVADRRNVVFTGFGNATARLNVQQLFNSFSWGIDNRIHGALGGNASIVTNAARPDVKPLELRGRDFSFDPRALDLSAESGGGQWGLSFDDEGNKFVCSNARHIAVEMYEDRFAARNKFYSMPSPDVNVGPESPAAEIFRLSPEEPWRVLRTKWRVAGLVAGPVEGGGRASGYFSGASGITIYRGDAFPPEFHGDVFIADCGSNLIHRKRLRRDGLNFLAERAPDEQRKEFLASRDNWFRPVTMANAPDGTLYVVDMYRETVEHPWSLPPELKSKLDLNSGMDRGRIFRIVPTNFAQPKPVRLGDATTPELVKALDHANGWHRDAAARLLCERRDTNSFPSLQQMAHGSKSGVGRVHALHTLRTLAILSESDLRMALRDSNAVVRTHAVRLAAETRLLRSDELRVHASDEDIRVRFQLALVEKDSVTLVKLIQRDVENSWMRAAVLGGLGAGAADVFAALVLDRSFVERAGATEFLREAARIAGASAPWSRVALGLRVGHQSPNALALVSSVAAGLEQRGTSLAAVDRKSFDQFNERARLILRDAANAEPSRIEAVEFLGRSGDSQAQGVLMELLAPNTTPPLQVAAVAALSRRSVSGITNNFVRWPQLTSAARAKMVSLALSRRDATGALLRAVEQGSVARTELSAADVQRLTEHSDAGLRAQAKKIFQRDDSARTEVVKKFRPALELKGDAMRGRVVYQQRCASCHRAGNEGHAVGPDLASVAASGGEKLLTSILDPNVEVAAAFVAYTVETKSGDSHLGVLAGENPLAVMLKLPNGETARVGRENVLSMRGSDKSLMPEGLEEGLSNQDMADLLEFIARGVR
jgi:putative membrane-bound dehydrogenase-like protein